jgi:ribonuclease P protein component
MKLVTIKHRPDFQRIRGGVKFNTPAFLLEAKARPDGEAITGPRFGFTITKKIGNAVERNRMRRRLKEAIRRLPDDLAHAGFDYVVVARKPLLDRVFLDLCSDLETSLKRVHKAAATRKPTPPM